MTTPQPSRATDDRRIAKYTMAVAVMMTGISANRIRKFEESGLCKPERTASNQRLYSDNDIELIRKIALLNNDGVNSAGIRMILNLGRAGNGMLAVLVGLSAILGLNAQF